MKQNDEIEDLFQSTFDDFSVEPPQNVKSSIDDALFNSGGKKNRIAFYLATFLIFISITGLILYNNSSTLKSSQKENRTSSETKTNSSTISSSSIKETETKNKKDELLKNESSKENIEISNPPSVSSLNEVQQSNNTLSSINKSKLKNKNISDKNINSTKNNSYSQTFNGINSKSKDKKSNQTNNNNNILTNTTANNTYTNGKADDINKKLIKESSPLNTDNTKSNSSNTTIPELATSNSTSEKINTGTVNTSNNSSNSTIENKDSVKENTSTNNTETSTVSPSKLTETGPTTEKLNNDESSTSPADQPLEIPQPISTPLWMLSIRSGSSFSSNTNKQEQYKLQEKNTFFFNLESSYLLQNKINLTSGIQYNKISSDFNYSSIYSQNVYNGIYDTILTYPDTANPTIADTSLIAQFNVEETNYTGKQTFNQTSFSIPLYIGYSKKMFNNFYIDANAGMIFSYQQAKILTPDLYAPDHTIRNIGVKLCIRPQIRYQFGKFGVSLSSNFGYDLVPTLKWTTIPYKRLFSDFGVGIHYQF